MRKVGKALVFVAGVALAGCSTQECKDYSETLKVEKRVEGRWNALIEKNFKSAYTYTSESYRDMITEEDYTKSMNRKIIWKSAEITRTRCNEDVCKVHLTLKYHVLPQFGLPRGADSMENTVENWLRKGSEWWYLPPISSD